MEIGQQPVQILLPRGSSRQHVTGSHPQDNLFAPPQAKPSEYSESSQSQIARHSDMSDLNSPEKPRSEPSLSGSQPHSWSDVTLIEDITQDASSRHHPAFLLEESIESSSESAAEQRSPSEPPSEPLPDKIPAQAVCVVKRFRARSRSRGPGLPIASAPGTTQPCHAPCDTSTPRLLPLSLVPRPGPGLPVPEPPASRRPTPPWSVNSIKKPWDPQPGQVTAPQVSYRARMPRPPSKGGLQPSTCSGQPCLSLDP